MVRMVRDSDVLTREAERKNWGNRRSKKVQAAAEPVFSI
jgi:hypothetical protein